MANAAGCTISVILFVMVMETILKGCRTNEKEMTTPLRSFRDDITTLVRGDEVTSIGVDQETAIVV